jgi:hypothetical protein
MLKKHDDLARQTDEIEGYFRSKEDEFLLREMQLEAKAKELKHIHAQMLERDRVADSVKMSSIDS